MQAVHGETRVTCGEAVTTKSEIELFRADLRAFEQRVTLRLGGLIVVATGIIIAVIALTG